MNRKDHFLRMFTYDDWANREYLTALQAVTPVPAKVLRLLAHIVFVEKLWLERLQGVPQSVAVWPGATLDDCHSMAAEMRSAWRNYLSPMSPADFEQQIDYRNSKGEPWSSRVDDVLTHVLIHSAYHRGQAALEMRAAGLQPPSTDFIHGVRQGFVD